MEILVVGGAGYIGSHMVKLLVQRGFSVTVFDNLSTGHRDAVHGARFVLGDLFERDALEHLCQETRFVGVMHFAAHAQIEESLRQPAKYYRNNVFKAQNLLDVLVAQRIRYLVFSSTAAIFGEAQHLPIAEDHPKQPINPYGKGKWMVEQMLEDYDAAYGLKFTSLRSFNAAGAAPDGTLGEQHVPETHLIPLVLQVASGRHAHVKVFGNDYPTPDGTCIRDYVHVHDLCEAHLLALQRLQSGAESRAYNLGNGQGFSVQQVIDSARRISDCAIATEDWPRRSGDAAQLIADARRAREELGWNPQYTDLDSIIAHAWQWERRLAAGD